MNFLETRAGQDFITHTMPRLVKAIEEHTAMLKEQEKCKPASTQAAPPCSLCHVCVHFNNGEHYPGCRDCTANCWGNFVHINATQAVNASVNTQEGMFL